MYDRTDMIGTGMTGIMELQSLMCCSSHEQPLIPGRSLGLVHEQSSIGYPPHEQPGGLNGDFTHTGGNGLIKLVCGNSLSCKHTSSGVHGMTLRHFAEQQLSLETVLCLHKVLRVFFESQFSYWSSQQH